MAQEELSSLPMEFPQAPATATISQERKDELLLKARRERLEWIEEVPLPYGERDMLSSNIMIGANRKKSLKWSGLDRDWPMSSQLLIKLYGSSDLLEEKLQEFGMEDNSCEDKNDVSCSRADEILEREIQASLDQDPNKSQILSSYRHLINLLRRPEAAVLVNSIRRHLRLSKDPTSLDSFIQSTWESSTLLQQHSSSHLHHAFEAFCFGQAFQSNLLSQSTNDQSQQDKACFEKFASLQFLTPKHLDLQVSWKSPKIQLQLAVQSLLQLEIYYSPFYKLQCILETYRQVTRVLTQEQPNSTGTPGDNDDGNGPFIRRTTSSAATADDVLPTLILTVIYAQPKSIMTNLIMIQNFASQEYLRGEAGYAYTNLYGAVQFLMDIQDETKLTGLSAADYEAAVAKCRAELEERLQRQKGERRKSLQDILPESSSLDLEDNADLSGKEMTMTATRGIQVTARQVRQARLEGQTEWSLDWAREQYKQKIADDGKRDEASLAPRAFSYSFFNHRPEDIKLCELPQLLDEYKHLVHMTERLWAEKNRRDRQAKRIATAKTRAKLAHSFEATTPRNEKKDNNNDGSNEEKNEKAKNEAIPETTVTTDG